jgi:hypothetical protein
MLRIALAALFGAALVHIGSGALARDASRLRSL